MDDLQPLRIGVIRLARPYARRIVVTIAAACYGGCLIIVSIVLLFVVDAHESRRNSQEGTDGLGVAAGVLGGVSGVILYYMVRYGGRWPQPFLMLVLGIATIAGAVWVESYSRAKAEQRAVPQQPPPMGGPPNAGPPNEAPALGEESLAAPFDVDPVAKAAGPSIYLVELKPFAFQNSPWRLGMGVKGEDLKTPIYYEKSTYSAGISMHPPLSGACRVSFVPGKQFKRFKGWGAIGDGGAPRGPVLFAVWGDGRKLWESASMKSGAAGFDLDVTGVSVLTLETRMHSGNYYAAYAVWLDPWLER